MKDWVTDTVIDWGKWKTWDVVRETSVGVMAILAIIAIAVPAIPVVIAPILLAVICFPYIQKTISNWKSGEDWKDSTFQEKAKWWLRVVFGFGLFVTAMIMIIVPTLFVVPMAIVAVVLSSILVLTILVTAVMQLVNYNSTPAGAYPDKTNSDLQDAIKNIRKKPIHRIFIKHSIWKSQEISGEKVSVNDPASKYSTKTASLQKLYALTRIWTELLSPKDAERDEDEKQVIALAPAAIAKEINTIEKDSQGNSVSQDTKAAFKLQLTKKVFHWITGRELDSQYKLNSSEKDFGEIFSHFDDDTITAVLPGLIATKLGKDMFNSRKSTFYDGLGFAAQVKLFSSASKLTAPPTGSKLSAPTDKTAKTAKTIRDKTGNLIVGALDKQLKTVLKAKKAFGDGTITPGSIENDYKLASTELAGQFEAVPAGLTDFMQIKVDIVNSLPEDCPFFEYLDTDNWLALAEVAQSQTKMTGAFKHLSSGKQDKILKKEQVNQGKILADHHAHHLASTLHTSENQANPAATIASIKKQSAALQAHLKNYILAPVDKITVLKTLGSKSKFFSDNLDEVEFAALLTHGNHVDPNLQAAFVTQTPARQTAIITQVANTNPAVANNLQIAAFKKAATPTTSADDLAAAFELCQAVAVGTNTPTQVAIDQVATAKMNIAASITPNHPFFEKLPVSEMASLALNIMKPNISDDAQILTNIKEMIASQKTQRLVEILNLAIQQDPHTGANLAALIIETLHLSNDHTKLMEVCTNVKDVHDHKGKLTTAVLQEKVNINRAYLVSIETKDDTFRSGLEDSIIKDLVRFAPAAPSGTTATSSGGEKTPEIGQNPTSGGGEKTEPTPHEEAEKSVYDTVLTTDPEFFTKIPLKKFADLLGTSPNNITLQQTFTTMDATNTPGGELGADKRSEVMVQLKKDHSQAHTVMAAVLLQSLLKELRSPSSNKKEWWLTNNFHFENSFRDVSTSELLPTQIQCLNTITSSDNEFAEGIRTPLVALLARNIDSISIPQDKVQALKTIIEQASSEVRKQIITASTTLGADAKATLTNPQENGPEDLQQILERALSPAPAVSRGQKEESGGTKKGSDGQQVPPHNPSSVIPASNLNPNTGSTGREGGSKEGQGPSPVDRALNAGSKVTRDPNDDNSQKGNNQTPSV